MLLFQKSQKSFWNVLTQLLYRCYGYYFSLFGAGQASAIEAEELRDTWNNDDFEKRK